MSDSNILATVSGNQWVQINPDTYVNDVGEEVTAGEANDVTIKTKVTNSGGRSDTHTSDGFVIKGGGDNKISVSEKTITITNADYGMSASGDNDTGVSVNLMKTAAGSTEETVKDKVTFKSGTGIKLSVNGDEITIDGSDLATGSSQGEIKEAKFSNEAEGFKLTLAKGSGSKLEPTFSPVINYGSTPSTAKFANGTATLDVYTQAETDKKIESALMSFNALTYKGTVGGDSATIADLTAATDVHNGDVYMASGNANVTVNGTVGAYDAGTLFIAQGTEDVNGVISIENVTWTVVQNYNTDTQTQVDLIPNGIKISEVIGSNPATELGSLVITSGTTDILTVSEKNEAKATYYCA